MWLYLLVAGFSIEKSASVVVRRVIIAAGSIQEHVVSHGVVRVIIKNTASLGSLAGNNRRQGGTKAVLVSNNFATKEYSEKARKAPIQQALEVV